MRTFDNDGRILCNLQAEIFMKSIEYPTSSPIFIRRYMNSEYCEQLDGRAFLNGSVNTDNVFSSLDEQYGQTKYGETKYSSSELNWIGYLYRYWAYVYGYSSKAVFRLANGREMHELYYAYHSLDPAAAIERIMESKNQNVEKSPEDYMERGVKFLRDMRKNPHKRK